MGFFHEKRSVFDMVIIMKPGTKQERIRSLVAQLEKEHGVKVTSTSWK